MNRFFTKLKFYWSRYQATKPTRLPVGVTEFNNWADDIIRLYSLPDNDTIKFTLATMILHAKSEQAYWPKKYFGHCVLKSMANQVAAGMMQDIKAKYEEQAKQEQAKILPQKSEATKLSVVASDGPKQS